MFCQSIGMTFWPGRHDQECWKKKKAKLNCWKSSFARKVTSSTDFETWLKYSTKVENYAIEEALHFFHHPFNVVDAILLMHTEIRTGMTFSSSRVILSWLSPHVHELTTRNRLITTRKSFLSWLITGLQSHVHELTMLVPRVILNFLSILMQRYAILMRIWRIKL